MKKRSIVVLLIVSLLAMAFTGSVAETADKKVIGVSQIQYTSEWRIAETNSMIRALIEAGYEVIYTNAQGETQQQIANCEDLLSQGIDYLMLSPLESNGLTAVLEDAKAQNVPVILIDRWATGVNGEDFVCYIGTEQVGQGAKCAEWIVENIGETANIVVLQGDPSSSSVQDRGNGFYDVIEQYEGLKVVSDQVANDSLTEAQTVFSNILQSVGAENIDVVFSMSTQMAHGVVQAMYELGLTPGEDIDIVTINGLPSDLESVLAGEFQAVVQCNPFVGDKMVEVLDGLVAGDTSAYGQIYYVDDTIFTAENAQAELDAMVEIINHDSEVTQDFLN